LFFAARSRPVLLIGRIAAAKDDELSVFFEEPRRDGGQEVHALLLDEPADHAEDRSGRVDGEAGGGG